MKLYFATLAFELHKYEDIREFYFSRIPVKRILVSYAYPEDLAACQEFWEKVDNWFLDCGAWTAFTKGKEVDIDEYGEYINREGWRYTHICSLDAIGNGERTKANWLYIKQNYPKHETLPTFHIGEPFSLLEYYLSHQPSLILLGAAGNQKTTNGRERLRKWLDEIFLNYPYSYHMFGVNSLSILTNYPFASCDASSYLAGRQFGKIFLPNLTSIDMGREGKDRNRPDLRMWMEQKGLDIDREDFHFNEFLKINLEHLYQIFEVEDEKKDKTNIPRQMRLI